MSNKTKVINVGNRVIGGGNSVLVQSMTNTHTQDVKATVDQIHRLEEAGCDIIRVAVPDIEAAEALKSIKRQIHIPLVADIHFDYRLAIESIISGADKIRINPGNIGDDIKLKQVVDTAKAYKVPIRIGVNSGSLEKNLLEKYGKPTAEALVESTINKIHIMESMDFDNLVLSIKSSNVRLTIDSYLAAAKAVNYPLHLGITEAGTPFAGTVKSAVGMGTLLYHGIGDTIRVSLTGDPVEEVKVARELLKSLELLEEGIEIISCPTCGRCNVDLVRTAEMLEQEIRKIKTDKKIKIAVMGCAVNGPGEAREADLGIAGGNGEFLLFIKGQIVRKIPQEKVLQAFLQELKAYIEK